MSDPIDQPRVIAAGVALSTIAMMTFLVLPQFVEAAVGNLGYSEREVGILSSLIMAGSTIASLAASAWVRRLAWRRAALMALLGLFAANGASLFFHAFAPFAALQLLGGFFGGSLYSLALTVLSDGRHPDRNFGFSLAAQVTFQIVGLLAGSALTRDHGINGLIALFAGLCILGIAPALSLPVRARGRDGSVHGARLLRLPTLLALAGCFLFFFNVGCYWTYIELIGSGAGLAKGALSNGLAIGVAFGIPGSLLASWLRERRGRLLPIAVSAFGIVISALMLIGAFGLTAFVSSAILYNIAWNLSLAYQYSTVSAVDESGRGIAVAPAFHGAGGAAGPLVAGLLVSPSDHSSVLWLVCVSVMASLACFALATRLTRRAGPETMIETRVAP